MCREGMIVRVIADMAFGYPDSTSRSVPERRHRNVDRGRHYPPTSSLPVSIRPQHICARRRLTVRLTAGVGLTKTFALTALSVGHTHTTAELGFCARWG